MICNKLKDIRQKLMNWMIKTQDPLLKGKKKGERKK
jgi:hypothetical protein